MSLLALATLVAACAAAPHVPPAPAPAPPASEPAVPAPPGVNVMESWLASKGITATPVERPSLALGGWRFYLVQYAPGVPGPTLAVGPTGELVTRDEPGGWGALLSAGTPAELAERVAFLDHIAMLADPAAAEPGAAQWMGPPSLGAGPTYTVWLAYPPSVASPVRLVITLDEGGPTFTYTPWSDVAAGK